MTTNKTKKLLLRFAATNPKPGWYFLDPEHYVQIKGQEAPSSVTYGQAATVLHKYVGYVHDGKFYGSG